MFSYHGYTFRLATSEELQKEAKVFTRNMILPGFPRAVREDRFAGATMTGVAMDAEGRVAGVGRLVVNGLAGLPIQREFIGLPALVPGDRHVAEVAGIAVENVSDILGLRTVTSPGNACENLRSAFLVAGLYLMIQQVSERLGVTRWVTVCRNCEEWLYHRRHGLPFEPLVDEAERATGRIPATLSVADAAPTVGVVGEAPVELLEEALPALCA